MLSPPANSYSNSSRRNRYSRSPSPNVKRSKVSSTNDHNSKSDQTRLYTSICVKNIHPKISDLGKKKRRILLKFFHFFFE